MRRYVPVCLPAGFEFLALPPMTQYLMGHFMEATSYVLELDCDPFPSRYVAHFRRIEKFFGPAVLDRCLVHDPNLPEPPPWKRGLLSSPGPS